MTSAHAFLILFRSVFIEYLHASAARLAHVQLNEKSWGERTVYIDFAKERQPQKEEKLGIVDLIYFGFFFFFRFEENMCLRFGNDFCSVFHLSYDYKPVTL